MKQVTCKQLGGPCDEVLEGETPKEIFGRVFMHIKESGDPQHQEIFREMANMSDEDCEEWDKLICNTCQNK